MKKLLSLALALALLGLPLLAGCEKDEIRVQRQHEVKNVTVHQDTVVTEP